jgi:hypothetical protein
VREHEHAQRYTECESDEKERQPLPSSTHAAVSRLNNLVRQSTDARVRFGSKADILAVSHHVRFTPKRSYEGGSSRLGCPAIPNRRIF